MKGFVACRVPAVCPDWSDSMVDAAAEALLVASDDLTDEAKLETFYVLESFVRHYARHPVGRLPPDCVAMYDRVVSRMTDDSSPATVSRPDLIAAATAAILAVFLWL